MQAQQEVRAEESLRLAEIAKIPAPRVEEVTHANGCGDNAKAKSVTIVSPPSAAAKRALMETAGESDGEVEDGNKLVPVGDKDET